ncbi:uncharacterized protein L969DRAFT_19450 [Mixia osmundae IAM 14324]|uniref:HIT domain-containing protein n=1 Tax=Mixia osmundae (strain CBS 9802 / IAM 14324 / JCM 22182 / KY 12970) TaxID=764103 RepID=G7DUX5_MIXOS|nr:uncharacterized protein L969DRAFT_19450 [Mixia osmundae IAM 14324]KEI37398.1 hypothetical protein L969DRAFT_19450 [Mixia osmundae IAM 14324]GAA94385.1 hypothetical protein E5Q_01036 [Mixia osmundae IAM 14324]
MTSHLISLIENRGETIKQSRPSDPTCPFCGIINDGDPAHIAFENEDVIAILDILPISRGHTLVIPKAHHEKVSDLPDAIGASIGRVLPRIARAVCRAIKTLEGGSEEAMLAEDHSFNVVSNSGHLQVVPHVHFHIVVAPAYGKTSRKWKKPADFVMGGRAELNEQDGTLVARTIREAIAAEESKL